MQAQVWFTVEEAAAYLRQSVRKFTSLPITAHGHGARKVYHRDALDAWMFANPWHDSTSAAPATTSIGPNKGNVSDALLVRLTAKRLRPYKPRKKPNSTASSRPR